MTFVIIFTILRDPFLECGSVGTMENLLILGGLFCRCQLGGHQNLVVHIACLMKLYVFMCSFQ